LKFIFPDFNVIYFINFLFHSLPFVRLSDFICFSNYYWNTINRLQMVL